MALLLSERQTSQEAKQAYTDSQAENAELIKKLENAEGKVNQLQDSVQRLEKKLSHIESENQVLRRQALAISPTGKALPAKQKITIIQRTPENGNILNEETKMAMENQDLLIKCISRDLCFSGGRPISAYVTYKFLLHWRLFEVERTSVFDRISQTILEAVEAQDNNDTLSYWLSNSSTLLFFLQRTLKASGAAGLTPQRRISTSTSLFGRMS